MDKQKAVKVLVTGGAGFIGSHLTEELLGMGYQVLVVDDLSTGNLANLKHLSSDSNLEVLCFSVNDACRLQEACKGASYVFHQAAIPSVPRSVADPVSTNYANITGTLNVLVAARDAGVKKVVYASSSSVYGDTPTLPKKEAMVPEPLSPYAVSKLAGEHYCAAFTASYGLQTACLRYFNVYGPRQAADSAYAAVIPKFIQLIKQGKPPQIFGDGTQTRDFTFVKDVVRANILASQSLQNGAYNIGTGSSISLNELAHALLKMIGYAKINPVYSKPRPGDVAHSLADISKAEQAFGYRPLYTLSEGLKITVEEYGE
ncbi:MAG: SDR family oxidoreductase [Dehalococcoidales bacterium]|jgi:UDP-glucose 4-epimerase|nr:SDR family oxidoreductase [Dehalococcoidales bacterium]MDD4465216.1 SDR family oxidoreductase [Dehalococcoidales bacterium]MDD5401894.1 SDR family oxidoreductase [Dehalococcoidales bacterium]